MCGIVGAMFFPAKNQVKNRHLAVKYIFTDLLLQCQERGEDATGVALVGTNFWSYLKGPWPATEFILQEDPDNDKDIPYKSKFLKDWTDNEVNISLVMGHCRKKTVGLAYNNLNNHPIVVPDVKSPKVIGIHNGSISNHKEINDQLSKRNYKNERLGEVDSEMMFHVLNYLLANDKEPTLEIVQEWCKYLEGVWASCAVHLSHPNKIMFIQDTRPLEFSLLPELNVVLFTSEKKFIDIAMYRYKRTLYLKEGFKDKRFFPEVSRKDLVTINKENAFLWDTSEPLANLGTNKIPELCKCDTVDKVIYEDWATPVKNVKTKFNNDFNPIFTSTKLEIPTIEFINTIKSCTGYLPERDSSIIIAEIPTNNSLPVSVCAESNNKELETVTNSSHDSKVDEVTNVVKESYNDDKIIELVLHRFNKPLDPNIAVVTTKFIEAIETLKSNMEYNYLDIGEDFIISEDIDVLDEIIKSIYMEGMVEGLKLAKKANICKQEIDSHINPLVTKVVTKNRKASKKISFLKKVLKDIGTVLQNQGYFSNEQFNAELKEKLSGIIKNEGDISSILRYLSSDITNLMKQYLPEVYEHARETSSDKIS